MIDYWKISYGGFFYIYQMQSPIDVNQVRLWKYTYCDSNQTGIV